MHIHVRSHVCTDLRLIRFSVKIIRHESSPSIGPLAYYPAATLTITETRSPMKPQHPPHSLREVPNFFRRQLDVTRWQLFPIR